MKQIIELCVRFTVEVESDQLPEHVEDLCVELPLEKCELFGVDLHSKAISAKFVQHETFEVYKC